MLRRCLDVIRNKVTVLPILFFLLLSGILIFCWFRFGYIYGGGDTGLPTYNPAEMAKIAGNIWWESLAPGIPVAQGLTSVPMLFLLSIPQSLGASPVFIQALLFFVLLFLMGFGMYLLARTIFGLNRFLGLAAGVFYIFNPYMMIQIWHRFIHNSMFFVAFLPFLIITWMWWIRKRNPKFLLLFLTVNFLAVYIFGTIAFIVAVWTLLTLLTLLEALIPWKGRKTALSLFVAFLIGLLFWFLTNSWWLIPIFNVSPALLASQHTTDDSLATLMSLSNQTALPYTLRLVNPFYLYWHADFGNSYQNIFFQLVSWLSVLVVFIGFIKGLKDKVYVAWSLLFLILIFLAKGAAPPFSFPYIWGFTNFFPLGLVRNPFEKLGVLLPLTYAVLFSLGLHFLLMEGIRYIGKSKTYFLLIVFILLQMVFFWPMFTGKLFGSLDKPAFVEIPESYTQANNWIKQDLGDVISNPDGRILHLPLSNSESITYKWHYGYNGVEPSAAIFTALPSIARNLDIPGVNDALSGLSLIFHKPYAESNQAVILKMLQDFNIKYIILHKDIEWLGGELYNPSETETVLNSLDFLDRKVTFGDLTIYKLKDASFSPKIIISDNVELLSFSGDSSRKNLFWPWIAAALSSNLITIIDSKDSDINFKSQGSLLFPKVIPNSREASSNGLKEVFEVPYKSKYEILLSDAEVGNFYSNKLSSMDFLINGEKASFISNKLGNLLSFGEIELNSGLNEIDYGEVLSKNLISDFEKWNKIGNFKKIDQSVFQINVGDTGFAYVEGDLNEGVYGGGLLKASFDISTNPGIVIFIQILQDSDPDEKNDNNRLKSAGVRDISSTQYFSVNTMGNWQNVSLILPQLRSVTQKAKMRLIMISPYQSELLQTPINILIRNLAIERVLNNSLILRHISDNKDASDLSGEVSFSKEDNPSLYQGKIKLTKPSLLIFKETFHSDWKLALTDNQQVYYPEKHYLENLYANAWYIDKPGDYDFRIYFKPQNYVIFGIIITASSASGILFFIILRSFNRKK